MRRKLAEEAPHLVEEWITRKNNRPIEEITAGSRYKAWWKCKTCMYKWVCTVISRTRGSGCPKCAGRSYASLLDKFPSLSKEWIIEKNDRIIEDITTGAGYKAWWECRTCSNQWEANVTDRVRGSGCPKCAGHHGTPLIEKSPHLAEEWVTEKNDRPIEGITTGSGYHAWWKCTVCNHEWQAKISSRAKGSGCRPCSYLKKRKRPLIIEEYQYLAEEWSIERNEMAVEEVTAGSVYKAWWKCKTCSNEWLADVQSRVKGTGCPKCAGHHGTPLLKKSPYLAQEWITEKNDRPIDQITAGSGYKAWWECKTCQNQWSATIYNRAMRGSGCSQCAGHHGTLLLEKSPHLVQEWVIEKNDRPIDQITAGSGYKAWWECKFCHNQWLAKVLSRIRGSGCPQCIEGRNKTL